MRVQVNVDCDLAEIVPRLLRLDIGGGGVSRVGLD
jgi:hypothetical protein